MTKNVDSDKYSFSRYWIGFDARGTFLFSDGSGFGKNFTEQEKKFCLSLHYYGVNSYMPVHDAQICKFKVKDSEINATTLYLDKVSKGFSNDNMKKTRLYRYANDCSGDYESIDDVDILDIRK